MAFEALGGRTAEETAQNAHLKGFCEARDVDKLRDALDIPRGDGERRHHFLHDAHMQALERGEDDDAAHLAFQFFDRDDDGFVARDELGKTL